MPNSNPESMAFVEWLFEKAAFIADAGVWPCRPRAECDSELAVLPKHLQQDGIAGHWEEPWRRTTARGAAVWRLRECFQYRGDRVAYDVFGEGRLSLRSGKETARS